ncbi:MAG: PEP-CTERM sorting domain-containing protein [Burkholderiaceae bacterium]
MKQFHIAPAALTALALVLAAGTANAQVVNGQFNNGLAGWTTGGDAAVVGNHLSLTNAFDATDDTDGVNRNLSGNAPLVSGQPGGLEDSAGVAQQALDPNPGQAITAIEGSIASQSFLAAAGSQLSFKWDLSTQDQSGDPTLADIAFVVIDGKLTVLGNVLDASTAITGGTYAAHTGWADWSTTFASGGTHTIAFGVADIGDYVTSSALDVSDVTLTEVSAVPETSTLALMAAGLGLLALRARRRQA